MKGVPMLCRRCKKEADEESTTPLGGFVVCPKCIEEVLAKVNEGPIYYFGRCFRDDFRLCTQDCSHLELAAPEVHNGTPKILSAYCHATSEPFFNLRDNVVIPGSSPVVLRRRTNDEFLAALWLTRLARFLEREDGGAGGGGSEDGERPGGYREGTWE